LAVGSVPARAQTPGWTVNLSSARASVNIGDYAAIWSSDTVTAVWARPDVGGWVATAERGERNGIVDFSVGTRGYKHLGAWTLVGGASATPNSHFLPAATAEGEISRRFGTLVPSAGYRYLGFQSADIHQIQPALTWYHARGNVEARVFLTRNMTTARDTGSALLRTTFAFNPRLTVGGGAATGDRIFDVASLPYGAARAHLGFAEVHVGVTAHDFIQVGATVANEQPGFTYRAFTVGYQRTF
jgi:YaiO family outer membrane protein